MFKLDTVYLNQCCNQDYVTRSSVTRHVHKIRSPRRWNREEHFTGDPVTLACSFAPPLQFPSKSSPLRCSVLPGQPFAMELPLISLSRCELMQWSVFWMKQLQKWSKNKKCLKISMWQIVSCANRSLKSIRVQLATWQESFMTWVYIKCHSACESASTATMITLKNSFKSSLSISETFIANKHDFYAKKLEALFCRHTSYNDNCYPCSSVIYFYNDYFRWWVCCIDNFYIFASENSMIYNPFLMHNFFIPKRV